MLRVLVICYNNKSVYINVYCASMLFLCATEVPLTVLKI